jgi:hypothetical protein
MTSFINWFIDSLASEDVIDLSFILSDMVDIYLTDEERCETAYYDSLASASSREPHQDRGIPIGKRVY